MTETLIALVPTYGLWLIVGSVLLSCLAMPIPSSMLVMTAGGFAASGDLVYWQVVTAAASGFVLGDQTAFGMARVGGARFQDGIARRPRAAAVMDRAKSLVERRGAWAVFLSRTVLSPIGPYVSYLTGALQFNWPKFTLAAVSGAIVWSAAYSGLGFLFATRIAEVASLVSQSLALIAALAVAGGLLAWLVASWRHAQAAQQKGGAETDAAPLS